MNSLEFKSMKDKVELIKNYKTDYQSIMLNEDVRVDVIDSLGDLSNTIIDVYSSRVEVLTINHNNSDENRVMYSKAKLLLSIKHVDYMISIANVIRFVKDDSVDKITEDVELMISYFINDYEIFIKDLSDSKIHNELKVEMGDEIVRNIGQLLSTYNSKLYRSMRDTWEEIRVDALVSALK